LICKGRRARGPFGNDGAAAAVPTLAALPAEQERRVDDVGCGAGCSVMITPKRRAVLSFCACLVSSIALLPVATRLPDDDDVVVVRGWILKKSDLRKLGW
jgi:hypothetical protein